MGLFSKDKGEQITLSIEGMSCMHCVGKVEKGLSGLEGIYSAEVNLEKGEAVVQFDPEKIGPEDIKKKVVEVGYRV